LTGSSAGARRVAAGGRAAAWTLAAGPLAARAFSAAWTVVLVGRLGPGRAGDQQEQGGSAETSTVHDAGLLMHAMVSRRRNAHNQREKTAEPAATSG
jgi:hypothetical protein